MCIVSDDSVTASPLGGLSLLCAVSDSSDLFQIVSSSSVCVGGVYVHVCLCVPICFMYLLVRVYECVCAHMSVYVHTLAAQFGFMSNCSSQVL